MTQTDNIDIEGARQLIVEIVKSLTQKSVELNYQDIIEDAEEPTHFLGLTGDEKVAVSKTLFAFVLTENGYPYTIKKEALEEILMVVQNMEDFPLGMAQVDEDHDPEEDEGNGLYYTAEMLTEYFSQYIERLCYQQTLMKNALDEVENNSLNAQPTKLKFKR